MISKPDWLIHQWFLVSVFLVLVILSRPAHADWNAKICIEQSARGSATASEDQQPKRIVQKVADSIGLSGIQINVIACSQAEKAYSYVSDGSNGIAAGKYIIYNPDWLREVVGKNQVEMAAVFGHELGHILNDHFNPGSDLSRATKEAQADHFAGCAVGRLGGQWSALENLLSRLRREKSQLYPDRLTSIQTAKEGFEACGGGNKVAAIREADCPAGYTVFRNLFVTGSGSSGISIPEGAKVCFIVTKLENNKLYGLEIRERGSEGSAGKYCRIMFSADDDDTRNYIYPMGPEKTIADCAAQVTHRGGKFARLGCGDHIFGPAFEVKDYRPVLTDASLSPYPNCGWK